MKTFEEFLNESKITLADLDSTDIGPVFIIVCGGPASGKNTVFNSHFPNMPLVDMDEITFKLSGGDFEKRTKILNKAIGVANKEIDGYLKQGVSFGQVTVGGSVKTIQNKVDKAHSMGYSVAVVLIDVNADTAIKRMNKRAKIGKQSSIPEWKVIKGNERARETYRAVKADYNIKVNN
jgi:predicted ABC-type ATPase